MDRRTRPLRFPRTQLPFAGWTLKGKILFTIAMGNVTHASVAPQTAAAPGPPSHGAARPGSEPFPGEAPGPIPRCPRGGPGPHDRFRSRDPREGPPARAPGRPAAGALAGVSPGLPRLTLLFLAMSVAGCAYYNTFYLAKKYYAQAERS